MNTKNLSFRKIVFLFIFTLITVNAANIEITNAYIRATPPGIPNSASFLSIKNNTNEDIYLLKIKSSIAKNVEMHQHQMLNGMMKMSKVEKIRIEKNQSTVLKPGGFHIMLLGLKNKPLKENQNYEFTYMFSNKVSITKTVQVKSIMSMMKKHNMPKHNMSEHNMPKHNMTEHNMPKHNMK